MGQFVKSSSDTVVLNCYRDRIQYGRTTPIERFWFSNGSRAISEYRSGTFGADWRKEVRRHRNAATGMSANRTSYHGGSGQHNLSYYVLSSGKYVENHENDSGRIVWVYYPAALPPDSDSADNEARMRLYKQANQAMRAFQSFVAVGELRETLRMIRNPAKKLFGGIHDYMQSVVRRTRRARKFRRPAIVSETWLEYTFGWAPLINDVRGATEGLNRRLERYAGSYTRVSGQGETVTHSFNPSHSQNQGGILNTRNWGSNSVSRFSIWYRGEVKSVCPNPMAADARLFGATWSDVLPAAWELVPWSFVADYFTNVGDILDSWSIRDSDWAWLFSTTQRYSRNTSCNVTSNGPSKLSSHGRYRPEKGYTDSLSCSPARAIVKSVARATPLSANTPSFRWEIPGVGSKKWLNLAALGRTHKRLQKHVFHFNL